MTDRPSLRLHGDAPLLALRLAIIERDGRQFLVLNGTERDVTGWRQVTVTLVNGADGRCGALVSLDGEGEAEAWEVEDVRAVEGDG